MDAYGASIHQVLRHGLKHRLTAFAAGMGTTTLLQSSTATGLIAAPLTATAALDLVSVLAIMLGANIGTPLIVQLLAFDISILTPVLVLAGVLFHKFSRTDRQRDVAKALIGLGFMLFALAHMTTLLGHAAKTDGFQALLGLVSDDLVLSLVFGALWLGDAFQHRGRIVDYVIYPAGVGALAGQFCADCGRLSPFREIFNYDSSPPAVPKLSSPLFLASTPS